MRKKIKKSGVAACALLTGISLAGCLTGGGVSVGVPAEPAAREVPPGHGPPPHAPAHGYRAKYGYRYYPSVSVYFDVNRKLYFYLQNGDWKVGVSLPDNLRLKLGDSVTIEMDSDKPYTEFQAHKAKYPPPGQVKKNNKDWEKK
ncbi:MAG: hypothetical protein AB1413_00540 [Thermodesulfobacteriota bacterium]